jgi:uncharacterized protein (DUF58 family)
MFKLLRQTPMRFAVVAGTMFCLALGSLLIALAMRQQGELELATFWLRAALFVFVFLVIYALPRLTQLVNPDALPFNPPFHIPLVGLTVGALLLVVAVTAFSSGNNLLYLIFALLMATLVVSAVAARLNLTRLGLEAHAPKHIFAGEPTTLEFVLSNRKRLLPAFSLTVSWRKAKAEPEELAFFAIVPPRAQARARLPYTFARRGVYALRELTIITRFPFGFIERYRALRSEGELVVYPQLRALSEFAQALPFTLGQLESPRKGSGSDLYALRPYQPTDHRHAIDWKATAKTASLMVREFTHDDDWRVTIIFAIQAAADEGERFERAISLTASLLDHLLAAGAEVRLVLGAADLGYGATRAHCYALLRELARLKTSDEQTYEEAEENMRLALAQFRSPANSNEFRLLLTSAPRGALADGPGANAQVIHFAEL